MRFYHFSIVVFFIFLGCKKESSPNPDLAGMIIGTFNVKESVTILNSRIDTTRLPYLFGEIFIERSNTDPTKIGVGSFVTYSGNGDPVSEEQFNEMLKLYPAPNPQASIFSVSQKNDTLYFTDNQKNFGKCFGTTLTYRHIYSPTWETTFTSIK